MCVCVYTVYIHILSLCKHKCLFWMRLTVWQHFATKDPGAKPGMVFPVSLNVISSFVLQVAETLWLLDVRRGQEGDDEFIECNNMTLINLVLKVLGPTHERNLTAIMLLMQVNPLNLLQCAILWVFQPKAVKKVVIFGIAASLIYEKYIFLVIIIRPPFSHNNIQRLPIVVFKTYFNIWHSKFLQMSITNVY